MEVEMKLAGFLLILTLLLAACVPATPTLMPTSTPTAMTMPNTPYFGQPLPSEGPVRFGRGFLSGNFHSSPSFTQDGSQAFWAGDWGEARIYTSRLENGTWTKPAPISFSPKVTSYRDPFVSPDGKQLFFISTHQIPESAASSTNKENIWVMQNTVNGWSEPKPLPDSVNSLPLHWTISVAANGNLYYSAEVDGNTDLYLSRFVDGMYTNPVLMDASINTAELEITPNIAPDESYLLFSRLKDTSSYPKLFISYAVKDGWSEPRMVENVPYCISPIVTPDRKYVIFMSTPSTLSWRNTSFVEALRPK
jgi:hypothetical protein